MLLTAAAALLTSCSCSGDDQTAGASPVPYVSIDTVPLLITQIQKCARLYTTEYKVHKIVTHDDVVRLQGSMFRQNINVRLPLGNRKVAIPIDAKLKAYIDFSQFGEQNIEQRDGHITILLPDPVVELTSSKVNQKEIRTYIGLVRSNFTDAELSSYEQQGREAIIQSVPQLGIVDMARENAARVLVPMLSQLGYREQDITVAFRREFKSTDITRFVEIQQNKD